MARTRLTLLGSLNLNIDDQPFAFAATPTTTLLGYLALHATHGRVVARAMLAGKLWPNLPEKRARYTLNDTLYRLRRALDDTSWLYADTSTIQLVNVFVDVDLFKTAAASCHLADWQLALDLYRGDLLEDLDADWLLVDRVSLHDLFLHTLARVCTALADSGRIGEALTHARRWALADPFNEDAHRAIMRLAARLGQYIAALQQYDHLVRLLDEEFQTAPLPETRALANAIRAEYDALPSVLPDLAPLVGRQQERAALLRYAEQAQRGAGRLILVEGEPGIGKTRLVGALAEGAIWRGMHVASSCARPDLAMSSYAPFDEVICGALSCAHGDQLHPRLTPCAAALLHDLEQDQSDATARSSTMSSLAFEDICAAFDDLLQALSDAHPCLLILDDMQWAGPNVWLALQACAPRLHTRRLLVVVSYRGAELRNNPAAWRALRSLDLELAPIRMTLQQLSPEDCGKLAGLSGVALEKQAAIELHQRSGGNPRLIHEILAGRGAHVPEASCELAVGAPSSSLLTDRSGQRKLPIAPVSMSKTQGHAGHTDLQPMQVQLARADAPLGRTLATDERISVRWTVDAGEPDAAVLRSAGKIALRRHRIRRLIAEAHAQGGTPTDTDLARALGVTERTIVADMAVLRAAGQPLHTRRRRSNGTIIS